MAHAGEPHLIREFRIVLPLTVDEYHVGQLWSVAEASKNETGGGEGVEVVTNEPFGRDFGVQPSKPLMAGGRVYVTGQYTHKIYHISQKVPAFIRMLAPKGSLEVTEKAWNAYPYCRTIVTNTYMAANFYIIIESFHAPDSGITENIHGLSGRDLKEREVVHIDIANDKVSSKNISLIPGLNEEHCSDSDESEENSEEDDGDVEQTDNNVDVIVESLMQGEASTSQNQENLGKLRLPLSANKKGRGRKPHIEEIKTHPSNFEDAAVNR